MYVQILQNMRKSHIPKHPWSQALQIKDTQPAALKAMFCGNHFRFLENQAASSRGLCPAGFDPHQMESRKFCGPSEQVEGEARSLYPGG